MICISCVSSCFQAGSSVWQNICNMVGEIQLIFEVDKRHLQHSVIYYVLKYLCFHCLQLFWSVLLVISINRTICLGFSWSVFCPRFKSWWKRKTSFNYISKIVFFLFWKLYFLRGRQYIQMVHNANGIKEYSTVKCLFSLWHLATLFFT